MSFALPENNRQCIAIINAYWAKQGFDANAREEIVTVTVRPKLVPDEKGKGKMLPAATFTREVIVSDTINGLPRRKLEATQE